jgi:hypothetical protein
MNTTTATLDRMICKSCKMSARLPEGLRIDWMQVVPRIADQAGKLVKHECGNYLRGQTITGRHSDKTECGPKCQSATGPACECKCRGENHGA